MSQTDLLTYIQIFDRWKRFLVLAVGTVAIASVLVSFFLPKWYTARSTLIPPQTSDLSAAISSLVQGVSLPGIGNVAPVSEESTIFMAILDSRTLRARIIHNFDLVHVYKAKNMDDALRRHQGLARVGLTDKGVVEVAVEDRDPQRAAEMANAWVAYLDEFNKNSRMTAGKKSRLFIEARLEETKRLLHASETLVAAYQREHKNVPLSPDVARAVDASAEVLARRMALQIQLGLATDLYTEDSPQVTRVRAELAAIDRETDALPPLAIEYTRLLRDMKVQEQVYAVLVTQYEEAKIREVKDTPTLEVLDRAEPPQRRSRPIRWLFCSSLTAAAAVLLIGAAFGTEFVRRLKSALASPPFPDARDDKRTP
jgi:uncharacterized protein involved in exopolysaccharide biosynthesis